MRRHFGAGKGKTSRDEYQSAAAKERVPGKRSRVQMRYGAIMCKTTGGDKQPPEPSVGGSSTFQQTEQPAILQDRTSEMPFVASANAFVREIIMPTLSIEDPELRAQADKLVRRVTPWPMFKRMIISSHEWDEPIRRAVFVRYFSELQRAWGSEGEPTNINDIVNDVVSIELEFWQTRNDIGVAGEQAVREDQEGGNTDTAASSDATTVGFGTNPPQATGSGLVVFYDSMQRLNYAKAIKVTADQAVIEIGLARELGDLARSEQVARRSHMQRNYLRSLTQSRVTPGARMMSGMLEGDRSWDTLFQEKSRRLQRSGGRPSPFDIHQEIAEGSGRTRGSVLKLAKVGAIAGPAGALVSAGMSGKAIADAPPDRRTRTVSAEIGGATGGTLGSMIGGAATTAAIGFVLGSNPAAWVVIGATIIGGAAGGAMGSEVGRGLGERAHDMAMQVGDALAFTGDYVADEIRDSARRDTCENEYAPPELCAGVDRNHAFEKRLGYDPGHWDD